jgi:hypothetical protein
MRSGIVLLLLVAVAAGSPAVGAAGTTEPDMAGGRAYCEDAGGAALAARSMWATNQDPATWLELAGAVELCRFEDGEPGASGTTRIYVDLVTLYSEQPTLAGVAYLSRVPPELPESPSTNPARAHCAALGGSAQFGSGLEGGGWVTSDRPTEVVDLCVFPDRSFIDEFGIFYYAGGVVRGTDLADVMRYAGEPLPPIFSTD